VTAAARLHLHCRDPPFTLTLGLSAGPNIPADSCGEQPPRWASDPFRL